jgi:CRP/FNR family transcriptional regulator
MCSFEIQTTLSKVHYFAELDDSALNIIAEFTLQQKYDEGQIVFSEGESCKGLYIVQRGWAQAVKISPDGREQVIRIVGPGDVFNEVGVLSGGMNIITVIALEELKVLIIQKEALLEFIDQYQSMAKILIRNLARRVMYAMNLVSDLSLHSVECRLARYLLQQAEGNCIHRKKWATQAVIAARIGTVPVVVNRAFRSFVEKGLIKLERECILILDSTELTSIAGLQAGEDNCDEYVIEA